MLNWHPNTIDLRASPATSIKADTPWKNFPEANMPRIFLGKLAAKQLF